MIFYCQIILSHINFLSLPKFKIRKTIRIILLSFLFTAAATAVHSASLVQGRIYLKDGRVIECEEKDRLKIPKHKKDVKLFRRAYYKDKSKEVYA